MMKSGEFSAGGRRDHQDLMGSGSIENIDVDGFDQNGQTSHPLNPNDQYHNPRPFMNHQNYGNPNFVPPPQSSYSLTGQP